MKYEGKIYGKVAGKYVELNPTANAKVLMKDGRFISNLIEYSDVFEPETASLFPLNETIDSLVKKAKEINKFTGRVVYPKKHIDLIRKCELKEVHILIL